MTELLTENYQWSTLLRAELLYASIFMASLSLKLWYYTWTNRPIYPGDIADIINGLGDLRNLFLEIRDNLERLTESLGGRNPTGWQIDLINFLSQKFAENNQVFENFIWRIDFARIWGMYENELREFRDELPELVTHITTLLANLT